VGIVDYSKKLAHSILTGSLHLASNNDTFVGINSVCLQQTLLIISWVVWTDYWKYVLTL